MNYSLKDVCYLIESNSFETTVLFEKFVTNNSYPIQWKESNNLKFINVGNLNNLPVCFNLSIEEIDGIPVGFWYPTSQVVDYAMIDEYFKKEAPQIYENSRYLTTDAQNFHTCIQHINNLDKTKFKVKNSMTIF